MGTQGKVVNPAEDAHGIGGVQGHEQLGQLQGSAVQPLAAELLQNSPQRTLSAGMHDASGDSANVAD